VTQIGENCVLVDYVSSRMVNQFEQFESKITYSWFSFLLTIRWKKLPKRKIFSEALHTTNIFFFDNE